MLLVSEQTFQPWYYKSIPHNLSRNPLPRGSSSPSASPGSSCLILYRLAVHTGHLSILSYFSPRYRMQSLMHACIFCTSNPRGQITFFASCVVAGNSLSGGSFDFIISSNFSNPVSEQPKSAFHFNSSSVVPSFVLPSSQFGYKGFL